MKPHIEEQPNMKSYTYRVGAVQTLAKLGDVEANLAICAHYAQQAAHQGVKLLIFPECMNVGYLFDSKEHALRVAEPVDGRYVQGLARLARRHGMFIASGMAERDKERAFCSGVLVDPSGMLIGHYHKQFLATHDQNWFAFGEKRFPVIDTELGRLGMMICFDGRIPEIARCTSLAGVQVIVDMANFFVLDQAEMWGPARAMENGVWLCASTKSGQERSIYYPGGSMIVDPLGTVRAQLPYDHHGIAVAEVDPSLADDKRWFGGCDKFADRRPDTYSILTADYASTPVASLVDEPLVPKASAFKMAALQSHACAMPAHGIDEAVEQSSHAGKLGVKLMTLPEYVASPEWYITPERAEALADGHDSLLERFAAVCRAYGCCILVPDVEREAGRLYPTSVLLGPDGETLLKYRKVHLYSDEKVWASAGDSFPVAVTPFGRVGVTMGYDGDFPESSRILGLNGADVILWPARLQDVRQRRYLLVPRAADNHCVVLLANRIDTPYPGGSLALPANQLASWDIEAVTPRYTDMHKVLFGYFELASCRQKQIIGKVDVFANRLTATYGPLTAAVQALA